MKNILESIMVAFSMYSRIPMPRFEWNKKNMRYVLCFFPLVGIVEVILTFVWAKTANRWGISSSLYAAVMVFIPFLVTGGIHMDGFCDTIDALSSHKDQQEKLQILKDPHTGAFAIIGCVIYYMLSYAFWGEILNQDASNYETLMVIGLGYIFTRCLSGVSVITFGCAKSSGLAATFSEGADKVRTKWILIGEALICCGGIIWVNLIKGSIAIVLSLVIFIYYKYMSKKQFGGVTGDLAGWFLQVSQISILGAMAFLSCIN